MKRIIALALAVCLGAGLLSGCSGGEDAEPRAMGRYVEQQVQHLDVDRVADLRLDEAGNLVFYTRRQAESGTVVERCVLPAGGGELERSEVKWISELGSTRISESADGWVYAIGQDEAYHNVLWRCAPDGRPEKIEMPEWSASGMDVVGSGAGGSVSIGGSASYGDASDAEPESGEGESGAAAPEDAESEEEAAASAPNLYVQTEASGGADAGVQSKVPMGLQALPGGSFLIYYGEKGASRYGADGTLTHEYAGLVYQSAAVHGNTLLMLGGDGKGFWSYDLDTGKSGSAYAYDGAGSQVRMGLDDSGVYLGDASGIYRQAVGGSVWEKLVDGELTSLSMPAVSLDGLVSDGGDGFWAMLAEGEAYQLVRYVYDADTPTTPDTELSIFGLTENNTVAQAIGEFQRQNPNVRINYRVGLGDNAAATAEEVIRALNTELVAGKGPDLLLLDGLPVDSYVEKGVLSDLTGLVDGLDGLMTNLMNAYARDGKLYGVPARFSLPVMMGREEDVAAVRSLTDLAAMVKERQGGETPFLFAPSNLWEDGGMLLRYYNACAGDFNTGGVDEAALTAFLRDMSGINKTLREFAPENESTAFATVSISVGGGRGYEMLDSGALALRSDQALFHGQELGGQFGLKNILDSLAEKDDFALDALFGRDCYTPVGGVGIVAGSDQQELARAFIQMLLSPTVQDSYLYDGFPVNAGSLEKLVAEAAGAEEAGGTYDDMGFLELCRRVKTPILVDQVVKDAVESQARDLIDGTITPEQAAANVVEKTKLYLSE